ncbi:MAG: Hsp20/alpha crystallin family protein [Phycisphaerae bacterium]|nr:Hsp20/alpha crystallin family protein [Phycisphaerae bacterium]
MMPVFCGRTRWDDALPAAFDGLARWPRELERAIDTFLGESTPEAFRVDVRQDGDNLLFEAELPGVAREHVNVAVENGLLTIGAQFVNASDEKKGNYHVRERRSGEYSRNFKLPPTADAEKIDATLKNGILTLRIPTREEAKPRQIEVK